MAISLNWVNDYVPIKDKDKKELANLITKAGINVEKVIENKIDNLVIGEVLECMPHPDSDHLKVCLVDIGKEKLQIVCGASNVRSGLKVIVALPGSILPGNFEIKKSTIRGVESNGMICALFELGLEEKNEDNYNKGIYEVDSNAPLGVNALEYLGYDDTLYELDLNPNRTDCNNHLPFAYEVAAVLNLRVSEPDTSYNEINENIEDYVSLDVESENIPFYNLMMVKDVKIKESPDFIKRRLEAAGLRSINNVVDISNYVMLEYGQPLHFFDKDKVGNKIVVRMANDGEKITTLDEKERILTKEDIVISNGNEPLCIAGIMGGINSGITDNTKDILIESAIFNPLNIRYSSIRLDLRSEASLRLEKPLSYEYSIKAIKRACHLLEKYADAKVVKGIITHDKIDKSVKIINVTLEEVNNLLGMKLTEEDIDNTLNSLGFKYKKDNNKYEVEVPTRRGDIYNQKEDIIEEVGRIYGYDNIKPTLPITTIKKGEYSPFVKLRKIVSKRMRSLGFDEVKTYTLVSDELSLKYNYNFGKSIKLERPMLKEKSVVRQSILPSLLDIANYNIHIKNNDISIYEIANTYYEDKEYIEDTKLSFIIGGKIISNTWNNNEYKVDYYYVKGVVENLLKYLGLYNRYSLNLSDNLPKEIHPKINSEIIVQGETIGYFGKLHPMESKNDLYVCELSLSKIFKYKSSDVKYKESNKYPKMEKDVAFIVDIDTPSKIIEDEIKMRAGSLLTNIKVFDIYTGDNIGNNKKSIAYNLTFESYEKTLTEEEVMNIFNSIIDAVCKKYNAVLRDK